MKRTNLEIFRRNVAFTGPSRIRPVLFRGLGRCLAKDVCLIIGSTKSISGLCPDLGPKPYLRAVFCQWKRQP
jgi:chemotaxis protein methyltransferase CheR